jgi:formate dehydrogenase accessory protein FdhD
MLKMFKQVPAVKFEGTPSKVVETVVNDEEIEITINNSVSRRFSISPNSLKEFTVGYLLGEGLTGSVDNITEIKIEGRNITAEIDLIDFDIRKELVVGSDCFGGWRTKIEFVGKVESDYKITKETIFRAFSKLKEESKVWKRTGGTHIAGLVSEDKFIAIEDVSRHVAVDKVIGAGALENFDFSKSFIAYSGRMPADMLIKIARVGIPIIASNAAPTSSGVAVAEQARVTMIGFVRDERFNVYTHPHRISL